MERILFLGPMNNKSNAKEAGGLTVLFENLLSQTSFLNIEYGVIDTNKDNYSNRFIALILIYYNSILKIPKYGHVSLHGSANDFMWIAPFVVFYSKLMNQKISLRKFAGNFDEYYDDIFLIQRRIIDATLKASTINFFETKYLVQKFQHLNKQTHWFPNVRTKTDHFRKGKYKKRFVYVGQVRLEKGIRELLEVSNLLDDSYTIDLYGIKHENIAEIDLSKYKANYKGSILPQNVQSVLSNYDVLILPTYWKGEGYPGVVIEALSVGLLIVATKLRGINEMLDSRNSILVPPRNVTSLVNAVSSITEDIFQEKSRNAKSHFRNFDSEINSKIFFKKLM